MKKTSILFLAAIACHNLFGQGNFSGDIETHANFFVRDTAIKASGTPLYDNLKSSAEGWFRLNYSNTDIGLEAGVRIDGFYNSELHNPGTPYTAAGLGNFYVKKKIKDLTATAGYFYDQIGTGIAFRTYEDRGLGIDNALLGMHLNYDLNDHWYIKAFGGVSKNRFELYKPFVKGIASEGNFVLGKEQNLVLTPGIGVVNRTLDQASMDQIVAAIEGQPVETRFVPRFNTYIYSAYNTLNYKNLSWYVEGAYKTTEAIRDYSGVNLIDKPGSVLYSSLGYSRKGIGAVIQYKRTQNFSFRTSLNERFLTGMLNFIPPVSKQNSLRLPARYNAPTQDLEEHAQSLDINYSPKKGYSINLNYSQVYNLDFSDLYWRELMLDAELKPRGKKLQGHVGVQYVFYDRQFYEKEGASDIHSITPFGEISYKISKKTAMKLELQFQNTPRDWGQWAYAELELTLAPKWAFALADMWNVKNNPERASRPLHYPTVFVSFTQEQHRFTLSYVKQVEGIVCTGGVCRYEPAFSGIKATVTTSF